MRFFVSRTSLHSDDTPPCEEASRCIVVEVDQRTRASPDELPVVNEIDYRADWFNRGTNHRLINGMIARDIEQEAWCVEIKDVKELLTFVRKYGSIVINAGSDASATPSIEIYDWYRE